MDVLNEFPLVDEHGKRYREFGHGCREYAPTIVTTVGTVPAGTVICKHTEPEAVKGLPLFEQPIPRMQRGRLQLLHKRQVQAGNGNGKQTLPSPCTSDLR